MKTKEKKPTLKEKFAAYRTATIRYIQIVKNPQIRPIFTLDAYETVAGVKKSNAASAAELLAIVGTAAKLDQEVRIRISGINTLAFEFVSKAPATPLDLMY